MKHLLLIAAALLAAGSAQTPPQSESWQAFVQLFESTRESYLHEVSEETLLQGAMRGLVEALQDPFSSYASPAVAAERREARTGAFGGVGATFRRTAAGVEVARVYRGLPADEAGLRAGDLILEVDGVPLQTAEVAEVASLLRGPEGSSVGLTVARADEEAPRFIEIVRQVIELPVASAALIGDIGYIHIATFEAQTSYAQFQAQLQRLIEQGAQKLVLDLRDNGGGYLSQGVLTADAFLRQGDILYTRQQGVTRRLAEADAFATSIPTVVLVNRNSASAAEIVAAALQENGRAQVIGEQSFGKGVGQDLLALSDGSEVKLVTYEWLTPTRRALQGEGVTPDIAVADSRYAEPTLLLEGANARAGQTFSLYAEGELIGTATAAEDGTVRLLVQPEPAAEGSDVLGEAVVDVEHDAILLKALEVLRLAS